MPGAPTRNLDDHSLCEHGCNCWCDDEFVGYDLYEFDSFDKEHDSQHTFGAAAWGGEWECGWWSDYDDDEYECAW
jgi:hypothetical protein